MSLRRAVVTNLRTSVSPVGGRVFQAFLAPATAVPPYITVKLATRQGEVFGLQPVEVYIYAAQTSFVALDTLEQGVIRALHQRELVDTETGLRYTLRYTGSAGDAVDEGRKLINRVLTFTVASAVVL
ncbi:MAG: hypothetical protein DDT34_00973 [Firmicutes bacterium]|nr:hypothetical protein [candidate division NPL-UPA2 bacterium]MBT9135907.1 hypothetical protein [Bacillota bacterium]